MKILFLALPALFLSLTVNAYKVSQTDSKQATKTEAAQPQPQQSPAASSAAKPAGGTAAPEAGAKPAEGQTFDVEGLKNQGMIKDESKKDNASPADNTVTRAGQNPQNISQQNTQKALTAADKAASKAKNKQGRSGK